MGQKGEPTRIIQAQPSYKVRLLSGSYCSHETRVGEGSQMLPNLYYQKNFFLTGEQDSHSQFQVDERVVKTQHML